MPLIGADRTEIVRRKNLPEIGRSVSERSRGAIVTNRLRKHVAGAEHEVIAHPLFEFQIEAVIAVAPDRLLHTDLSQQRQASSLQSRIRRTRATGIYILRVDHHALGVVQPDHVYIA